MNNDSEILSIDSPKTGDFQIGGPWFVVQKNIEERHAVVALEWEGTACLGTRSFTGENGSQVSHGYPVWKIIPDKKEETAILASLDARLKEIIGDFLGEAETKITGEELSAIGGMKNTLALLHYEQNAALELCYKCYRNLVKIYNNNAARKKETQKWKDFCREAESKCTGANSEAEIIKTVEELEKKYFDQQTE